jgi:hypothetical protein
MMDRRVGTIVDWFTAEAELSEQEPRGAVESMIDVQEAMERSRGSRMRVEIGTE